MTEQKENLAIVTVDETIVMPSAKRPLKKSYTSPETRALTRAIGKKPVIKKDPLEGKEIARIDAGDVVFAINAQKAARLNLSVFDDKILRFTTTRFTEIASNNNLNNQVANIVYDGFVLDYEEIAETVNYSIKTESQKKELIKKVKSSLKQLSVNTEVYGTEPSKGVKKKLAAKGHSEILGTFNFLTFKTNKRGGVIVYLNPQFARYLIASNQITLIDEAIYRIPDREPIAYALANKISSHYSMYSNHNNPKANPSKLSVRALIKATSLPSYEDVQKINRNHKRDIIRPFIKSLERITVPEFEENPDEKTRDYTLSEWKIVDKNGNKIDIEPVENLIKYITYDEFINSYIEFKLYNTPQDITQQAIEHKKEINRKYRQRRTKNK